MNLKNKKALAAKVLGVGKERVYFNQESIKQISEAITRQDILDLKQSGAITLKPVKGRKKIVKRKHKRGKGKVKKKVNNRKQTYVKLTRKLRKHVKALKRTGQVSPEKYTEIRKAIKASKFKSKRHLTESEVKS